jgi:hypothetical protein
MTVVIGIIILNGLFAHSGSFLDIVRHIFTIFYYPVLVDRLSGLWLLAPGYWPKARDQLLTASCQQQDASRQTLTPEH